MVRLSSLLHQINRFLFSYDLPVYEKLTISPRFRVYVGLTNELRNDVINSSLRTMSYEMVFKYKP